MENNRSQIIIITNVQMQKTSTTIISRLHQILEWQYFSEYCRYTQCTLVIERQTHAKDAPRVKLDK